MSYNPFTKPPKGSPPRVIVVWGEELPEDVGEEDVILRFVYDSGGVSPSWEPLATKEPEPPRPKPESKAP